MGGVSRIDACPASHSPKLSGGTRDAIAARERLVPFSRPLSRGPNAAAIGTQDLSAGSRQVTAPEAAPLETSGILSGHDDRSGYWGEPESSIIVSVSHEEDEAPAEVARSRKGLEDQRAPDANGSSARIGSDRTEKEGRLFGQTNRPIANGPDETPGFLRDQTQPVDAGNSHAIEVGDLSLTVRPERRVQQGFDCRRITVAFLPKMKHRLRVPGLGIEATAPPEEPTLRRSAVQRRACFETDRRRRSRANPADA